MLQGYLEELRKTSLLEPEEELELWRRDAAGDEAAHQRLMTAYQPLVFKIASSFRLPEADTMELIQEGMVGLLEAAESYDYKRQVAFSLFAVHRIRGRMMDFLRREVFRIIGAMIVVSTTTITSGPNSLGSIRPQLSPFLATIRATSPLEIIPAPIWKHSFVE